MLKEQVSVKDVNFFGRGFGDEVQHVRPGATHADDCQLRDGKFIHGAATIQASAAEALAHFPILGRGPRHARAWQAIVVDNVLHLWRALGGAGYSASVNPAIDYATPPVRFGVALFAEVQRIAPSTVAKLLTDAKKREGTNIG